jgi:hypothetical protein
MLVGIAEGMLPKLCERCDPAMPAATKQCNEIEHEAAGRVGNERLRLVSNDLIALQLDCTASSRNIHPT